MSDRTQGLLRLRDLALAAVANLVPADAPAGAEAARRRLHPVAPDHPDWSDVWQGETGGATTHSDDQRLLDLAKELKLTNREVLVVALALGVEHDPAIGHLLASWQKPAGASRPTLGLLSRAFSAGPGKELEALLEIVSGRAVRYGLLTLESTSAPLPEQSVAVPVPLAIALAPGPADPTAPFPGVVTGNANAELALPESLCREAVRYADLLARQPQTTLVIRSHSLMEARAVARRMASAVDREVAWLEADPPPGFGPWLLVRRAWPVLVLNPGPGERRRLPTPAGYGGPLIVATGFDGTFETEGATPVEWRLTPPEVAERVALWRTALGPGVDSLVAAPVLGQRYRQGAERIARLGQRARQIAALDQREAANHEDVRQAIRAGELGGRHALAEPVPGDVPEEALVLPASTRAELDLLVARCRWREGLAAGLGPTVNVRYRPGVRSLLVGPSGCGKTLAAGWLATRLGLPLYRVDAANVSSKYIGETEKNLAELFAWAETAEVLLLFDEADALFGKRTEVRDSNDRFANAQTNYLLQRIESYDGITLLTSNSKSRFDAAFARRLDLVIEFALPSPEERRALWLAHLGPAHRLNPAELNQLAARADLAGGHIRNAVLTAAVLAAEASRPIGLPECVRGVASEYRKLGQTLPAELARLVPAPGG